MQLHYFLRMKQLWKRLAESTLTDRYQTTIPTDVRKELGLKKRDMIEFVKTEDGHLVLRKASPVDPTEFPAELLSWLEFIGQDQQQDPGQLRVLDEKFFASARELVGDMDIDLNQPLEAD